MRCTDCGMRYAVLQDFKKCITQTADQYHKTHNEIKMENPILNENTCWVKETSKGRLVLRLARKEYYEKFQKLLNILKNEKNWLNIFENMDNDLIFGEYVKQNGLIVVEINSELVAFATKKIYGYYGYLESAGIRPNYRAQKLYIHPALTGVRITPNIKIWKTDLVGEYKDRLSESYGKICKDLNLKESKKIHRSLNKLTLTLQDDASTFFKKVSAMLLKLGWSKKNLNEL